MFLSATRGRVMPSWKIMTGNARQLAHSAGDPLTVSILGRPNVGKSSLFNRLTRSKMAIVSNVPGTTRDRREGRGTISGLTINVIDTGGLDDRGAVTLDIQKQVEHAIMASDVVLFMVDAKTGITSLDLHFSKWLRQRLGDYKLKYGSLEKREPTIDPSISGVDIRNKQRDIILVANKAEGGHLSDQIIETVSDSVRLGFGEPVLISASHGDGLSDLAQVLINSAQSRGLDDGADEKGGRRKKQQQIKTSKSETTSATTKSERSALLLTPVEPEDVDDSSIPISNSSSSSSSSKPAAITIEERTIQLAIMGRPNVGKSTMLNAFVGSERSIAGPTPGLTRDAIHVDWKFGARKFRLVDTAGLTRLRPNKHILQGLRDTKQIEAMNKIGKGFDHTKEFSIDLPGMRMMDSETDPSQYSYQLSEYALQDALNALRFAQVVLLVVEVKQGAFSNLDLQLARKVLQEGRALVIAANKSDIAQKESGLSSADYQAGVRKHAESFMREFGEVPIVACSGFSETGTKRVLRQVIATHDAWSKRISTGLLNEWLKDTMLASPAARLGNKTIRIKYATQVKTRPPTFALFSNIPALPGFFERFLRSKFQRDFHLDGVPLRFIIRKTEGNPAKKSLLKQGKKTRRGIGHGEGRGVGPDRLRKSYKKSVEQDTRRRRDSRLSRHR